MNAKEIARLLHIYNFYKLKPRFRIFPKCFSMWLTQNPFTRRIEFSVCACDDEIQFVLAFRMPGESIRLTDTFGWLPHQFHFYSESKVLFLGEMRFEHIFNPKFLILSNRWIMKDQRAHLLCALAENCTWIIHCLTQYITT